MLAPGLDRRLLRAFLPVSFVVGFLIAEALGYLERRVDF
jgi:hypothetical protein